MWVETQTIGMNSVISESRVRRDRDDLFVFAFVCGSSAWTPVGSLYSICIWNHPPSVIWLDRQRLWLLGCFTFLCSAVWLLIHSSHLRYGTQWFRQDSGAATSQLSNNIPHPNHPPFYQLRQISVFSVPRAFNSLKVCKGRKTHYFPLAGIKLFTLSQSVICLYQLVVTSSFIHQRGGNDSIAMQSATWEQSNRDRSSN